MRVVDWWKRDEGEEERKEGQRRRLWEVDGEQSIEAVYEDVRRVFLEWTESSVRARGVGI